MTADLISGPLVSAGWLNEHLGDVQIVDVRPEHSFRHGHIPGAVSSQLARVPTLTSSERAINTWGETVLASLESVGITRELPVIFYEDFSGTNAARGVWAAEVLGFVQVALLDGGLMSWSAAGLPMSIEVPSPSRSRLEWRGISEAFTGADQLLHSINQSDPVYQIVDTRADLEWNAGTIPGAIHYEWSLALRPDGRFRPLGELAAELEIEGIVIENGTPVATFCGGGYRAAHTYVLLKALGVEHVSNYAPSWEEWGVRADLPVASTQG